MILKFFQANNSSVKLPLIGIILIVQLPLLPEAHPLQQFPPQLFTDDLLKMNSRGCFLRL
jgi:hypothetical protein